MIVIRFVEEKDFDEVWRMGQQFSKESVVPVQIEKTSLRSLFNCFIANPNSAVGIVAEKGGKLIGMLGVVIAPHIFDNSVLISEEIVWWVDKEYRFKVGIRLLNDAEEVLRNRGVKYFCMKYLHKEEFSPEVLKQFYKRKGYSELETSVVKEL